MRQGADRRRHDLHLLQGPGPGGGQEPGGGGQLELAKELEAKAAAKGVQLLLPTDVVLADNFAPDAASQTVAIDTIPDGWMGLDIGPDSGRTFQDALADCRTVIFFFRRA